MEKDRLTTMVGGYVYYTGGKYPPTTLIAEMEPWEIRMCMNRLYEYEEAGKMKDNKKESAKYYTSDYTLTNKQTGKIAFKCLICEKESIHIARTSDGKRCPYCDGGITPLGYVKKKVVK